MPRTVPERVQADERIAHLAHYDPLTDLPYRILMRSHLETRISQLAEGKKFAVSYLDVDEFKGVNDSLGHDIGDELLRGVADRLGCVRRLQNDLVARLGGDEFAIAKALSTGPSELSALAEEILAALRIPFHCKGHELSIDVSIGIAVAPENGSNLEDLLRWADLAMYEAKSSGRRTFRFFEPKLGVKFMQRRKVALDLARPSPMASSSTISRFWISQTTR